MLLGSAMAQTKATPTEYIDLYKDYAIIEMHRSGVPASITLAQGILESSSGNSRLAKFGNNHFGIKCKSDWVGGVMYADDDAEDECFRAYDSPLDSYKDHSDFLRTNWRYHPLFELDITDYKGWARGLRKAGYATNPKYHIILINLIERYELYQYDTAPLPNTGPRAPHYTKTVNDIPVMVAGEEDNLARIAAQNELRERHLRRWNDLPKGTEITKGDMVYLKPKRRKGSISEHVVKEGETMHGISQKYGIKLKHLYRKNRMDKGTEPAEGERLKMQKKRDRDEPVTLKEEKPQWEEKTTETSFVNPTKKAIEAIQSGEVSPGPIKKEKVDVPDYHIVEKNDNIYRIAERYHVFEEDILTWNKIDATKLRLGQKIYLTKEAADRANGVATPSTKKEPIISTDTASDVEQELPEKPTRSASVTHVVQPGETLYRISKQYGVSTQVIIDLNQLKDNQIFAGQRLVIKP
jgi:LysM repeat protein